MVLLVSVGKCGIFPRAKFMRQLAILAAALLSLLPPSARAVEPQPREAILIVGGVSIWAWEKFKAQPHDSWWMNFVRAARIRTQEIQAVSPGLDVTWLVYRPAYIARGRQDGKDLIANINSVREAFGVKVVYFDTQPELINYINAGRPRDTVKISDLEYFGHSNKACFLFDYSNNIDSASKVWLHESELGKIHRGIFARDAFVKSWGCHTGESMSAKWRSAVGLPMIGASGKTEYQTDELPIISTPGGRWTR